MVNWYKHDIPAWIDGTANLSGEAYRAYHIICQMIYLAEEPIALNERYLAGACNQSTRAFRGAVSELVEAKKITIVDGKISNSRVAFEIFRVEKNREHARSGGEKSGKVRKVTKKQNNNKDDCEAALQQDRSLLEKNRLDETREYIPPDGSRKKKSKLKSTISPDVQINSAQRKYALDSGIPASRIDGLFEKFKNHHISKGNLMADWDAAWRKWVTNDVEWNPPKPQPQSSWVMGDDFG